MIYRSKTLIEGKIKYCAIKDGQFLGFDKKWYEGSKNPSNETLKSISDFYEPTDLTMEEVYLIENV